MRPEWILEYGAYVVFVFLFLLGMGTVFMAAAFPKKIIGLVIVQSSVVLFFMSMGANVLIQALMLTAIVVGLVTLGILIVLTRLMQREESS